MASRAERVFKVVLFGATGCGKSSIINLLAGRPVAEVSSDVDVCTIRPRWYPISLGEKTFRFWDTMGFNQAKAKDVDPISPYEQAFSVLRNLEGGVDLILLCARRDGINASLYDLYWLLDDFFFGGRAKIALVLTNVDKPDKGWWDKNISPKYDMPAAIQSHPHACITTVRDGSPESDLAYDLSKHALEALLERHATTSVPLHHLHLSTDAARRMAAKSLQVRCRLSSVDATSLVKRFASPKRSYRAVLLGEHGAGKSSVINLISGDPVAQVSKGFYTHTLNCRSYEVNTGLHHFRIWDTIGLNGPFKQRLPEGPVETTARFVRNLHRQGDLDLLVFCKKHDWTSPWELQIFRLFREFLCEGRIPVAFIITHLEESDPMEEWWEKNGNIFLASLGIEKEAVAGHTCITSAQNDLRDGNLQDKLSRSQQLVHAMLEDSVSHDSGVLYNGGIGERKREEMTAQDLMDRCGLTEELATRLFPSEHSDEEDSSGWWVDERFGPDSNNCISLPILS